MKALFTGDIGAVRGDELINYDNLIYIGKIYMGSNMQPVDINFDTGSYHYLCEVHLCKNCEGNTYDYTDSRSFRYGVGSYTETYLDGSTLAGDFAYDTVCISSSPYSCAKDF